MSGIQITMRPSASPVYDFELSFYQALGIRWETGRRYRKLGVLKGGCQDLERQAAVLG